MKKYKTFLYVLLLALVLPFHNPITCVGFCNLSFYEAWGPQTWDTLARHIFEVISQYINSGISVDLLIMRIIPIFIINLILAYVLILAAQKIWTIFIKGNPEEGNKS